MFAAGDCPHAVIVFVDAWTSWAAQFLNSAEHGRYMDHLCDEVVPFIDVATRPRPTESTMAP